MTDFQLGDLVEVISDGVSFADVPLTKGAKGIVKYIGTAFEGTFGIEILDVDFDKWGHEDWNRGSQGIIVWCNDIILIERLP